MVREGSIVNLVVPEEVPDVAASLDAIDFEEFKRRFARLPVAVFRPQNPAKDEEYRYDLFVRLNKIKKFYRRAGQGGRAVIFSTDDPLDWFHKPS